jgi:cytochrome c-type biogenesis protein CcmH/NrfG
MDIRKPTVTTGQLDAFRLFKVLRSLHGRKADGILTLRQNDVQKEIRFAYGWPVSVRSNIASETLGPALVTDGLISSTEFRDVSEESEREGIPFDSLIVSKDLVARQRLKRLETKLSRKRILEPFGWSDGEFSFEKVSGSEETLIEPLNPLHLIIDSCAEVVPTPICVRFIGNFTAQTVTPTPWLSEHEEYFESVFPRPNILAAIKEGLTFEDVKSLPGDRPRNIRQAAALILSGLCRPSSGQQVRQDTQPISVPLDDADQTIPVYGGQTAVEPQRGSTPSPIVPSPIVPSPIVPDTLSAAMNRSVGHPGSNSEPIVRPPNVRSRTIITAPPAGRPVEERQTPGRPGRRAAHVVPRPSAAVRRTAPEEPRTVLEEPRTVLEEPRTVPEVPQSAEPPVDAEAEEIGQGPVRAKPTRSKSASSDSGRTVRAKPVTGDIHIPVAMGEKDAGFLSEAIGISTKLKTLSHYELLGVDPSVSIKMVRHEFRKLARKFHVDRFSRYELNSATIAAIQAVFIALNRAHEVLSNASERQEYDITLEFVRSAEKRTGAKANPSDKNARLQDALQAEKLVQVALAQLSRGEAGSALQRLQKALTITPEDPSANAGLAYAQYLVAQSKGNALSATSRSQARLNAIIREVPMLAEPHLYLGRILRDRGDYDDAVTSFKEALRLDPHLSQATSELRYALKRKQEAPQGFKGLFGRKK